MEILLKLFCIDGIVYNKAMWLYTSISSGQQCLSFNALSAPPLELNTAQCSLLG